MCLTCNCTSVPVLYACLPPAISHVDVTVITSSECRNATTVVSSTESHTHYTLCADVSLMVYAIPRLKGWITSNKRVAAG